MYISLDKRITKSANSDHKEHHRYVLQYCIQDSARTKTSRIYSQKKKKTSGISLQENLVPRHPCSPLQDTKHNSNIRHQRHLFFFCEKIPTPPGRVPCAEHLTQISPNPENGKKTKPPAPQCRPLERHRDGKSAKAYYSDAASSPALMQHLWKQNTHILSSCRTEIAGSPPTPTARAEDGKDGDP